MLSLQLLLERKSKEVEKLIEETEKSITDLAENINQAKVNSRSKPFYYVRTIKEQFSPILKFSHIYHADGKSGEALSG